MSILKSILHRYNTTNQNYDTLHPETEHAQVTDFGQGVIAHLASSTLVSLVTSVSTGSVFGKMVEKLLEASGVQYNFTNSSAWYICLGSLFGGLIIQGGNITIPSGATSASLSLALAFPNAIKYACAQYNGAAAPCAYGYVAGTDLSTIAIYPQTAVSRDTSVKVLACGY